MKITTIEREQLIKKEAGIARPGRAEKEAEYHRDLCSSKTGLELARRWGISRNTIYQHRAELNKAGERGRVELTIYKREASA